MTRAINLDLLEATVRHSCEAMVVGISTSEVPESGGLRLRIIAGTIERSRIFSRAIQPSSWPCHPSVTQLIEQLGAATIAVATRGETAFSSRAQYRIQRDDVQPRIGEPIEFDQRENGAAFRVVDVRWLFIKDGELDDVVVVTRPVMPGTASSLDVASNDDGSGRFE